MFFFGSWFTIPFFWFQMREGYFSDSFPVTCLNPIPLSTSSLIHTRVSCHRLMLQQDRRNVSLLTLTLSWAHPGQERVFDLRRGGFIQWKWSWSENSKTNKNWRHRPYGQFLMQYTVITWSCNSNVTMNKKKNLYMNFIIITRYAGTRYNM